MTTVRRGNMFGGDAARKTEEQREDALKSLAWEQMLADNLKSGERAENKRFIRRLELAKKEQEMEESILRAQRDQIVKEEQQKQEENMAAELQRIELESTRDEKMRQQIRENSTELRELESKLKSAYVAKERKAQMAEKEAIKFDLMSRDSEVTRQMKIENARAADAERQHQVELYEASVRYQQELERQLEERERMKQEEYEERLKEKLMVDEVVRKIYDEDQKERERQKEKIELTKKYIEEDKLMRAEWKRLEKERLEAENSKIAQFASTQDQRESNRKEEMRIKEEHRNRLQMQLAEKIAENRRRLEEMEQVRQDLYLEEQEEKSRQAEKEAQAKRLREKDEMQRVHEQQMHYKKLRQQAQQEEEEVFKAQMLAKFAEDDRIEQMNAQKRRLKQLEHKRAVEVLLQERRHQFELDREREVQEQQNQREMDAYKRKIIEEERVKLLQEHAPNLLGYLPKGVIQHDNDLEKLGPQFRNEYKARQIDPFDDAEFFNKK